MKWIKALVIILGSSLCIVNAAENTKESDDSFDLSIVDESAIGAGKQLDFAEKERFNVEKKREQVISLVNQGIDLLKKKSFNEAMNLITHTKSLVYGELYLFVYSDKGVCLAQGEDVSMVWQDLSEERDSFGESFLMTMIKKAEEGGGWHTYQWRDAAKVAYVKMVEKDGQKLMIGCGYFPHDKGDLVVSLVKGGVAFFNDRIKKSIRPLEIFSNFNYSLGDFILGDLYLYVVTSDVLVLANGALPNEAGQNYYNHKDDKGVFFLRNMVNTMKDAPLGEGRWFEYAWFNATKKAYMERVTDSSGISYFLGCGYNPDVDREAAIELVKRGYQFMKAHGKSAVVQRINDHMQRDYRLGQLTLFIYDLMGNVIANGENTSLLGKNIYDLTDMSGRYMVREIVQKAKDEGAGWLDFRLHKSFYSVYIEEVDLGADKYVLGTGLYPITKESTMVLMVKSAKGFFKSHTEEDSFRAFVDTKANFIRGDMSIFVLDTDGICYADGDQFDRIWKDLSNEKDDDGKLYIKTMLNAIKMGPAKIIYKENGMRKVSYIESVKKGDKTYIIGSSFYP